MASLGFQALLTLLTEAAAPVPSLVEGTGQMVLLSLRAQPGSAGTPDNGGSSEWGTGQHRDLLVWFGC